MDVRAIELLPAEGKVRARVADASGERTVVLEGEAAARVLREAARAVVAEIAPGRKPPAGLLDGPFWDDVYTRGHDGWELARPAPPMARWLVAHPQKGRRVLVVGCGRGHEARLFAGAGAHVVAVDISQEAIAAARALGEEDVEFRVRDLFGLAGEPERYDLVVEHCCFCAIDPARRGEYARVMAGVLVQGGQLVGLFWSHGRPGGPPFSVERAELLATFEPWFEVGAVEVPGDSVATRLGQEILVEMRRR